MYIIKKNKHMRKTLLYFVIISFTTCFFIRCESEYVGQYPIDSVAPQPVSNIQVENLAGAVKIKYELPDEKDILYVKAEYDLATGERGVYKTSVYKNTMHIKGFGKSKKTTIMLSTVDRSQNESTPIEVEIEPDDSPIYDLFNSIHAIETFGGIKLTWDNPLEESVMIGVIKKNESTNEFTNVENFYSSEKQANMTVRGLDTISVEYFIYVRDTYMNYSDTLSVTLKPYFEEELDKKGFVGFPLSTYFAYHRSYSDVSKLWDNSYTTESGYYYLYIKPGNTTMPFFTFDMGVKAKLSRIRMWQRLSYAYSLYNARLFEWYGTNDESVARDVQTLDWENNPSWIKLVDGESKRPSGLPSGSPVNNEDKAYAEAGEDFEVSLDANAVRFLRFKLIETWSGADGLNMMEIAIWGQKMN